jgi:hypothetical protein
MAYMMDRHPGPDEPAGCHSFMYVERKGAAAAG